MGYRKIQTIKLIIRMAHKYAHELKNTDWSGKSDPFVTTYTKNQKNNKLKTKTVENNLSPYWDFEGNLNIDQMRCQLNDEVVVFDIYDEDTIKDELIGST
ncbi:C2 domain [Pseudocohnilembus persalinus]|uniref:C2 domain n=1 Tax=Pseudocohnilembus persalinus TaxID=266149 RepID=A0A0V0QG17_PSEPJ|nr:C2 domain [Pseudocohnilembus persalinus]|eukprot:KRX01165.1 C2 domain [Pseudocohnilembus persalinus]